jgi:hypothetical protein
VHGPDLRQPSRRRATRVRCRGTCRASGAGRRPESDTGPRLEARASLAPEFRSRAAELGMPATAAA